MKGRRHLDDLSLRKYLTLPTTLAPRQPMFLRLFPESGGSLAQNADCGSLEFDQLCRLFPLSHRAQGQSRQRTRKRMERAIRFQTIRSLHWPWLVSFPEFCQRENRREG